MTKSGLMTIPEAAQLIQSGRVTLVAGDEAALRELPAGDWIGGSIPYFMGAEGGVVDKARVFVHVLPESVTLHSTVLYDPEGLRSVYEDGDADGLSFIVVPATSQAHLRFAKEAQDYPSFLSKPLVGWVTGVHLDDLGEVAPVVVDGRTKEVSSEHAAVLHAKLPEGKAAVVDIVNLFTQGDGDEITFDEVGFSFTHAHVNGEKVELAKYLADEQIDTKLPLVADYYGAMVNVSFQGVNEETKAVDLYAPVFPGTVYKIAKPVADYVSSFEDAVPPEAAGATFACNCILNFLYGSLEGKRTKDAVGPVTFGEIAYQLLNQTFVYVRIV